MFAICFESSLLEALNCFTIMAKGGHFSEQMKNLDSFENSRVQKELHQIQMDRYQNTRQTK